MYKKTLLVLALISLCILPFWAQSRKGTDSNISLSEDTHINTAVQILEHFSLKETGKKMINMSSYNDKINVAIVDMPWRGALDLIMLKNSLNLEEGAGYFALKDKYGKELPEETPESFKLHMEQQKEAQVKQIRIKAVAMLADRSYIKSLGIDWSTVLNGKVTVNAGYAGAQQVVSPFALDISGSDTVGGFRVDLNTLLKTIESNQKGSILAEPSILVSSGKTGHIQVGQDISIKTADEAGNTLDTFFSTGIIMNVEPTIVEVDGEELIMMKLSIERSSGQPSAVSTVITKSTSSTELILYNKEETVIAGLFDTDEVTTRSGVPILKDLPWWVFGIRYLTGYNTVERKEREFIITLKAEIVDNALNRLLHSRQESSK